MLTYFQAIVIGVLQGITELFPISSLGHSVLVPAWIGGPWAQLVSQESSKESPYLAFIVGLHVATALALLVLFWRDWVGIVKGFFSAIRHRRISTVYERMAVLIIIATIPAGILGLALEHTLRTIFAKPLYAAIFLTLNGFILVLGEYLRRRAPKEREIDPAVVAESGATETDVAVTQQVSKANALVIGVVQSGALLAGISRSGITMVGGLWRGLTREESIRFSFLLATPIILAAGIYKIPTDLLGHNGAHIHGQALAGAAAAFVAALFAAKFLERWFQSRTLWPFAIYCFVFGAASIIRFA
jgi:undecaprenyl-diphosphatase